MKTIIFLCSCVFAIDALAFDWNASIEYGADYSTNPGRDSEDEVEQWIHSPAISVGVTRESQAIEITADYRAERRLYEQDEDGRFDDESLVTGSGLLTWNALPERLIFDVEHFRTESTINAFQSSGPQNRQVSQRATAGVTYNQRLTSSQLLSLRGTSSDHSFEETDNDATVNELELAWVVPMSEVRSWEVFAGYRETEFDDFSSSDYDSSAFGGRFTSRAPTGELDIELAYTKTEFDSSARNDVSGVTGEIELQLGVGTPFQWGVTASREIGDRLATI
ncbi:MAG: hypothetical protein RIC89_21125, partial [Pseudomonadales bacterium]